MTTADFYIKNEGQKELQWIGSCEYETIDAFLQAAIESKTKEEYIENLFYSWEDDPEHYVPIHGWPHPYPTSEGSDEAYCFVDSKVLINRKDKGWKTLEGKRVGFEFEWPKFKSPWHE